MNIQTSSACIFSKKIPSACHHSFSDPSALIRMISKVSWHPAWRGVILCRTPARSCLQKLYHPPRIWSASYRQCFPSATHSHTFDLSFTRIAAVQRQRNPILCHLTVISSVTNLTLCVLVPRFYARLATREIFCLLIDVRQELMHICVYVTVKVVSISPCDFYWCIIGSYITYIWRATFSMVMNREDCSFAPYNIRRYKSVHLWRAVGTAKGTSF